MEQEASGQEETRKRNFETIRKLEIFSKGTLLTNQLGAIAHFSLRLP
jgi:hypothetical protein